MCHNHGIIIRETAFAAFRVGRTLKAVRRQSWHKNVINGINEPKNHFLYQIAFTKDFQSAGIR